jgi:signal transduction histidine kinase
MTLTKKENPPGIAVQTRWLLASGTDREHDLILGALHQLNTPLTWVLGYAELMAKGALPKAMHEQAIDLVLDGAHRLQAVLEGLEAVSRIHTEQGDRKLEPLDLEKSWPSPRSSPAPPAQSRPTSLTVPAACGETTNGSCTPSHIC